VSSSAVSYLRKGDRMHSGNKAVRFENVKQALGRHLGETLTAALSANGYSFTLQRQPKLPAGINA
jgi:hypothetical protein